MNVSTVSRNIEPIDESEVEHKINFEVGEGAHYTGQMKQAYDHGSNNVTWIKHGKGQQVWPDGAKYDGEWRNGMAEGVGVFNHANGDVYQGEFI